MQNLRVQLQLKCILIISHKLHPKYKLYLAVWQRSNHNGYMYKSWMTTIDSNLNFCYIKKKGKINDNLKKS